MVKNSLSYSTSPILKLKWYANFCLHQLIEQTKNYLLDPQNPKNKRKDINFPEFTENQEKIYQLSQNIQIELQNSKQTREKLMKLDKMAKC